jgi:AraC-like DNA-binding protein
LLGRFIGAVGLAAFAREVHQVRKVTARPRIAKRSVMRLKFDPVKLAQFPETIRLVCRDFGLSRAALYRLFEPDGGLAGYIRERRLHRAFSMLVSPARRHWNMIDFAFECKFGSDATFIRAFRRHFGMTPGEVRSQAELVRAGRVAPAP